MSEFDDIEDGGGEGAEGRVSTDEAAVASAGEVFCLSCGNPTDGDFCAWCGQKNDDLRRSLSVLVRQFIEDTFSFDSRMWRTLGLMAAAPGMVPKNYAHGKRSQFTPPVRLFLVVSFLFFLVVGLTNTLFIGTDVVFKESAENGATTVSDADALAVDGGSAEEMSNCSFQAKMRFFVKESDLNTDKDKLDRCVAAATERSLSGIREAENIEDLGEASPETQEAAAVVERVFAGLNWVIANPREFNSAFNNWLTRVMFFMTPVLALVLAAFIRGKDALVFDHMVLAFYMHAVSFAIIGAALILAQFGVPFTGFASFILIAAYFLVALKCAYGRGWIKTVWTAFMSGLLYLGILLSVVMTIVSIIVWQAAA